MLPPPPGKCLSSASRTCCTETFWSNFWMTTVPPANSTLCGMPLLQIVATPARMITHETTSACTRQRRKLKCGLWKICMTALNAQRRDLMALVQRHLEDRLRHENRREQVRHEADEQRHREAADGTGAELEEERRRDERRHVRVDQRPEHPAEAGVDRRAHAAARFELLLDALEDQHVRIDADPHRQHEAGDARQR